MAQLVEHILGKDEVPGPNPGSSSTNEKPPLLRRFFVCAATLASHRVRERAPVRMPRPKHEELALRAQGVGIFAIGEYSGSQIPTPLVGAS